MELVITETVLFYTIAGMVGIQVFVDVAIGTFSMSSAFSHLLYSVFGWILALLWFVFAIQVLPQVI